MMNTKRILAFNTCLMVAIVYYGPLGHWRTFAWNDPFNFIILALTAFFQIFPAQIRKLEKVLLGIGKVNGFILMGLFFWLIFFPFGFLYRLFFKHDSFSTTQTSTFVWSDSKSKINFQWPF